jgi:hypothetical protein
MATHSEFINTDIKEPHIVNERLATRIFKDITGVDVFFIKTQAKLWTLETRLRWESDIDHEFDFDDICNSFQNQLSHLNNSTSLPAQVREYCNKYVQFLQVCDFSGG